MNMTREEIMAEIKTGKRAVVLKFGETFQDLKAHTVRHFDEYPYEIQETANELIVIGRKRRYGKPKSDDLHPTLFS